MDPLSLVVSPPLPSFTKVDHIIMYVLMFITLSLYLLLSVIGMDFDDNIADIIFTSGQGVGDTSCTSIDILVDSNAEPEESFTIILQENPLVQVVQPNVSTVFIGET